jgi:hypothetical protein
MDRILLDLSEKSHADSTPLNRTIKPDTGLIDPWLHVHAPVERRGFVLCCSASLHFWSRVLTTTTRHVNAAKLRFLIEMIVEGSIFKDSE